MFHLLRFSMISKNNPGLIALLFLLALLFFPLPASAEPSLADVMAKLEQMEDRIDGRFDSIEQRLIKVETRLDGIDGRLDRLENRQDTIAAEMVRWSHFLGIMTLLIGAYGLAFHFLKGWIGKTVDEVVDRRLARSGGKGGPSGHSGRSGSVAPLFPDSSS